VLTSALASDYAAVTAFHAARARELGSDETLAAILLDIGSGRVYGEDAETLIDDLSGRGVPVLVLADDENRLRAMELVERGAHSWVRKPPAIRDLKSALQNACEKRILQTELKIAERCLQQPYGLDQLVGSGAQMKLVYKLIRKMADLSASVLITGESGTARS
jgi:DNA-binding NtrC family response regulator